MIQENPINESQEDTLIDKARTAYEVILTQPLTQEAYDNLKATLLEQANGPENANRKFHHEAEDVPETQEDMTNYFAQVADKLGIGLSALGNDLNKLFLDHSGMMCSPWSLWSNFLSPGIDKQAWKHIKNCDECKQIAAFLDAKFDEKVQRDAEETDDFRKLVSLRRVDALTAIPGADFIEVAKVGGWNVVVKKGEFKVKGFGVFFEIDSFVPDKPVFSFLGNAPREYRGKLGYRLKTMKLRGVVSQGLLLPVDSFPELVELADHCACETCSCGWDVCSEFDEEGINDWHNFTKILGVRKWERVYKNSSGRLVQGRAKGNFPHFIQKTDEERLQNMLQVLEPGQLGLHSFEVTTKMDGSSMTAYIKDGTVGVCSRNLDLKSPEGDSENPETKAQQSDFWTMAMRLELPELLTAFHEATGRNIAIQGEFVGPGINGNWQKLTEWDFYLFSIYDIDKQEYVKPAERRELHEEFFWTIKHVPVISTNLILNCENGVSKDRYERFEQLMTFADSVMSPTPGVMAEGIVFKDNAGTHHFKLISNNYLMKSDKTNGD